MDDVRARYTYRPVLAVLGLFFAFPVACPIIWWKAGLMPGWAVPLVIVVATPLVSLYALFRLVYRLELTDTHLHLRAPLWTSRVPLPELREIRTSRQGNSTGRIVHGSGRTRTMLVGVGLADFLDQVRVAAPQARISVSAYSRANERVGRLFHTPKEDGR